MEEWLRLQGDSKSSIFHTLFAYVSVCFCWFPAWFNIRPWRCMRYVSPKLRVFSELYGIRTPDGCILVTAVITSNSAGINLLFSFIRTVTVSVFRVHYQYYVGPILACGLTVMNLCQSETDVNNGQTRYPVPRLKYWIAGMLPRLLTTPQRHAQCNRQYVIKKWKIRGYNSDYIQVGIICLRRETTVYIKLITFKYLRRVISSGLLYRVVRWLFIITPVRILNHFQ